MRMVRFAALTATVLMASMFAGCGGKPGPQPPIPPTPTPTPPPTTGVVNEGMIMKRDGAQIVHSTGVPFDFRGAKDCCKTETDEPEPAWPLGSKERNVWLKDKGNINMTSTRMGAFRTVPGAEDHLASIGGGYLEVAGKADLAQWNPTFWKYVDQLLLDNAAIGIWTQVGVLDGWGLKNQCQDGTPYHPWNVNNNLTGESHCRPVIDAVQETWIRKVVEVTGRHGNVVYETSNEGSLVPGWTVGWEEAIIAIIHDEEARRGYPRHLVASNAERTVPSADWNEFHTNGNTVNPSGDGKITGVNEYNPRPPMSGSSVSATYCAARAQGVYFWAWRHEMTLEQWLLALQGLEAGCGAMIACPHPNFEAQGWTTVDRSPQHLSELGVAEANYKVTSPARWNGDCLRLGGSPPGDNPDHAAERWKEFDTVMDGIASEMRKLGVCAWQHRVTEIHSLRNDGLWAQLHPLATGPGCLKPVGSSYTTTWKQP